MGVDWYCGVAVATYILLFIKYQTLEFSLSLSYAKYLILKNFYLT
jgi:hypothetical protein